MTSGAAFVGAGPYVCVGAESETGVFQAQQAEQQAAVVDDGAAAAPIGGHRPPGHVEVRNPREEALLHQLLIADPAMRELYADWEGVTRLAIAQRDTGTKH